MRHQGRMSRRHRLSVYATVGALWLSGCLWLILDQFFARSGPFGPVPNPGQPPLLLIHGVLAILSMYVFGWISARHIVRWWPGGLRRLSGVSLAGISSLLILSGFALFFLSDDVWQHRAALAHDGLGLTATLFGVQHWFFGRRSESVSSRA